MSTSTTRKWLTNFNKSENWQLGASDIKDFVFRLCEKCSINFSPLQILAFHGFVSNSWISFKLPKLCTAYRGTQFCTSRMDLRRIFE